MLPRSPDPAPHVALGKPQKTWLSPMPTRGMERLAYGVLGTFLMVVFLGGLAMVLLPWSAADLAFGLFSFLLSVLALALAYRMLIAAATGRRLYWRPGQREYDEAKTL